MKSSYDVVVVGGGTAGVVAAIQAGRAGAATLLVEKSGILGGTMTTGGINAPAHFFAWGRQVIAGIGWELVRRTLEETGLNDGRGINYRPLRKPVLPTIPRGALLPAGSRQQLVAGRCVASDHEANSALRVQAPCMAMGQAAGAMAALSAHTGLDPEELPLDDLLVYSARMEPSCPVMNLQP